MDGDEFDLPNAEDYFPTLDGPVASAIPPELLDEFDDDIFDDEGTAAQAVFALPELLERIILYVPELEVYRLQRVNTMFRDLISRSIPIRRHMYFVPEKFFVRPSLNKALGSRSKEQSTLAKAVYPFRFELYAQRQGPGIKVFPAIHWAKEREYTPPEKLFLDDHSLSDRSASWRTILILDSGQPLEVEFYARDSSIWKWGERTVQLKQSDPVTLGDVVDLAQRLTRDAWNTRARELSGCLEELLLYGLGGPTYYDEDDEDDENNYL